VARKCKLSYEEELVAEIEIEMRRRKALFSAWHQSEIVWYGSRKYCWNPSMRGQYANFMNLK